ncbi:hypothetical protein F5I97DRAFT_112097 [Phlebopus sp. FC_14]|nr:hypothetical protein F5I97DRAFT_112097 [Phlebopus sp. FC_14]
MFNSLWKLLGIRCDDQCKQSINIPLFSGYACFSKRVPDALVQSWVEHGGGIFSPGITRATYFFAIDTAEKWVTTLAERSVTVLHADWIAHCINQDFQLPVAGYVLDGMLFQTFDLSFCRYIARFQ